MKDDLPRTSFLIEEAIERAVTRLGAGTLRLLRQGAFAGALIAGAIPLGCDQPAAPAAERDLPGLLPGEGKGDWAQFEGIRDTAMVSYAGNAWHEYRDCNTRGGCMTIDVFIKLRVRPVQGASLDAKRVGIVYKTLAREGEHTALGRYFTTHDNGDEEWHVPVRQRAWEASPMLFNAWYQDGAGKTYYDDNNGELHAVAYQGSWAVIRKDWENTALTVDDAGVHGKIGVVLADLDFDKDVRLVWTTDDWKTVNEFGMGADGEKNRMRWVEDLWAGHERWAVDVEIPAAGVQRFQYAVVYRHGVVGGARTYEFWENNGGSNHTVERPQPEVQ